MCSNESAGLCSKQTSADARTAIVYACSMILHHRALLMNLDSAETSLVITAVWVIGEFGEMLLPGQGGALLDAEPALTVQVGRAADDQYVHGPLFVLTWPPASMSLQLHVFCFSTSLSAATSFNMWELVMGNHQSSSET